MVVRLGHPARVSRSLQRYSLDALLHNTDSAEIILDVRQDIKKALTSLRHSRGAEERKKWRSEIKFLKKELHTRELKEIRQLLQNADVILATTSSASSEGPIKHLPKDHFGVVVIDECAQAIEASCWMPLLLASKCVLAGDHQQLPPTVKSHEASSQGLAVSLLERVTRLYGDQILSMLNIQYRMNEKIMLPSSNYFYGGKLQAHPSVIQHVLSDSDGISNNALTSIPLLLIDTVGCSIGELDTQDDKSKGNEGEADLVLHHLKALLAAGVSPCQVAIIAPYSLQVQLIRKRLLAQSPLSVVEVHTVDGFQGREKDVVVISFTRSNKKGEYGFLSESRRSNVAATRARRHLALIGDSATITGEPFIKQLVETCYESGDVISAQDYVNDPKFEVVNCYDFKREQEAKLKLSSVPSQAKNTSLHVLKKAQKVDMRSREVQVSDKQYEVAPLFEDQLIEFTRGPDIELNFSTSLTPRDRRMVHELCEKMGLLHSSIGEGEERHLVVKKPAHKHLDEYCASPTLEEPDDCGYNYDADTLSCPPPSTSSKHVKKEASETASRNLVGDASSSKSKARHKVKKKATIMKETDDVDALLSDMAQLNSTCSYSKCRKSVKLISIYCSLCSRRYCVEHSLPEVHGCGMEAKKNARTPTAPSTTNADRAALQRKLHAKLKSQKQSHKK